MSVSVPSRLAALISFTKPTCDTRACSFETHLRMISMSPRLINASVTLSPGSRRLAITI